MIHQNEGQTCLIRNTQTLMWFKNWLFPNVLYETLLKYSLMKVKKKNHQGSITNEKRTKIKTVLTFKKHQISL